MTQRHERADAARQPAARTTRRGATPRPARRADGRRRQAATRRARPRRRAGAAARTRRPRHSRATSTSWSPAAQRDEYLALAQRTQADFENYRKRVARDAGARRGARRRPLARELLPALDNLDRALADAGASDGEDDPLLDGLRLVQRELRARSSASASSPSRRSASASTPSCTRRSPSSRADGRREREVVEVYQPGYRLRRPRDPPRARGRRRARRSRRWHPAPTPTRRSASTARRPPEEIKKAYRKLARQLPPRPQPRRQERRGALQGDREAYDVLCDPDKRAAYDRGTRSVRGTGAGRRRRLRRLWQLRLRRVGHGRHPLEPLRRRARAAAGGGRAPRPSAARDLEAEVPISFDQASPARRCR